MNNNRPDTAVALQALHSTGVNHALRTEAELDDDFDAIMMELGRVGIDKIAALDELAARATRDLISPVHPPTTELAIGTSTGDRTEAPIVQGEYAAEVSPADGDPISPEVLADLLSSWGPPRPGDVSEESGLEQPAPFIPSIDWDAVVPRLDLSSFEYGDELNMPDLSNPDDEIEPPEFGNPDDELEPPDIPPPGFGGPGR